MSEPEARRRSPEGKIAALVVLGLAVVLSWPLFLHPASRLRGAVDGDAPLFLWNFCWVGQALREGLDPLFSPELFAPFGADLRLHSLTLANSVPGGLLAQVIDPILSLNLLHLCQTLLAALGGWRLARALGLEAGAALYLACALAFHPYRMAHGGQLNLYSTGPMLLTLAALVQGAAGPLRGVIQTGLLWALTGLHEWYYAVYAGVAGLLFVLLSRRGRMRRRLLHLVLAAVLAAACLAPLLARLLPAAEDFGMVRQRGRVTVPLEAYVTPSPNHPLWHSPGRKSSDRDEYIKSNAESTVTIGLTPFLLAAAGVWSRRAAGSARTRQGAALDPPEGAPSGHPFVLALLAWVVLGAVLSLGPEPDFLGQRLPIGFVSETWSQLPLLSHARVASRWGLVANVGLLGLAAIGVARLGRRMQLLALLLMLFEYLPIPLPSFDARPTAETSEILARLERLPPGGLLHLPGRGKDFLLYQPLHGRPLANGFVARLDPRVREAQRAMLTYFRKLPHRNEKAALFTETFLRWGGIRLLWLKQSDLGAEGLARWRQAILEDFETARDAGHPALLLLADGNDPPALRSQAAVLAAPAGPGRCFGARLEIALLVPEAQGRRARLAVQLNGREPGARLVVKIDEQVVYERLSISGAQSLAIELGRLDAGLHVIQAEPGAVRRGASGQCILELHALDLGVEGEAAPILRYAPHAGGGRGERNDGQEAP